MYRLSGSERRLECRVCFAQRAREGKFHFLCHHHWIVAHAKEKGSSRDAEVNLKAGDALRAEKWTWRREVESEEIWTRKSEDHLVETRAMRTG
jgi:hypothetical protein